MKYRFCNRCGKPYPPEESRCSDCGSQEFSEKPTVTTDGWAVRNGLVMPLYEEAKPC